MAKSHEETIKTKLYQNWIKSGLGLKYLKEGLQPFVTQVIKDQHKKFTEKLQPCSSCSLGTLLPDHALKVGRNCSLGCDKCLCIGSKQTIRTPCQSNVCGKIYDKIVMSHFFADPNFSNSDITKWVEDPWELAKCYINAWGYKDKMSAEDTDCLGILSIIINDTEFYSRVDTTTIDIFKKVRTYRNDIMHLSNLEVTDDNLRTYVEDMIAILNDPNQLKDEEYAEAARTQLQKLLDKEIFISTSDEISVIREAQRVQASRIDDMIQDLDQIKKDNREHFDSIDKVQDCLRKATDDLNNKVHDQQKLAADIEQVKKDIESLKTELKDNCLQKIQEILQTMESEKLKKAKDKLEEHLKYLEDKNRLREKLFEMYEKHLSTRPISPVLEEVCAHVGDIYVDLVICDHILKEQHENSAQKKICVERYKDIFFRNNKQCFDIYMLGDAGMGKTTWCVKLVHDWVKVSKNKFDETRNSDLQCFEVVILVFLRNAAKEVNILDMIKEQLFSENTDYYDILTAVLKQEPQKCLVIADGLDEWKMLKKQVSVSFTQNQNIPSKVGLNGCPLLITSRISKIYDIRLKENEFDRCVKIEGIKETDKLAAKIINELNKLYNVKKQFKDFHETIEQIRLKPFIASLPFTDKTPVSECMKVPLLLIISVCIWFQYGKIEPTLAGIYSEMFKYLFDYACSMKNYEFAWPSEKSTAGTDVSSLPKELKDRIPRQCVDLILKMSKFAFDRLFEDCDESPQKLVFDEELLEKWFSSSDLHAAVKSGILSKSIYINQPLKRTASLSFLHKSFQEFLSAVHIVSHFQNENTYPFEVFQKYCCNYEKLTEMENVLLFVCGFDPRVASQMSLHIQTIAKQMQETETKCSNIQRSDYLMKNLPLKCTIQVHENNNEYPCTQYPIHIDSLSLSSKDITQHCLAGNIEHIYYMFMSSINKIKKVNVNSADEMKIVISQRRPLTVGGLREYFFPQPYIVSPLLQHCELPLSLKECALEYIDLSQFSFQQLQAFGKSLKQLTSLESLKLINVNCSSLMTLCLQNCRLKSLEVIDTNIEVKANFQDLKTLVVDNGSVKLLKELQYGHGSQMLRIRQRWHAKFYPDTINQMFSVFLLIPETKLNVGETLFEIKFVNKNTHVTKIDTGEKFRSYIKYDSTHNKYVVMYRHGNMQTNEFEHFLSLLDIYSIRKIQNVDFVFEDMNGNVHKETLTNFLRKCEISKVELTRSTSGQDSGDGRNCIQLSNKHLIITNNSVLETQHIIKSVFSTECIESMCTDETEHGSLCYKFRSRERNQPNWENRVKILLQKNYEGNLILTCLNTTQQETQLCVKLVSNFEYISVQIKTHLIDDETIATIFENKQSGEFEIQQLKGKIRLIKILETVLIEETYAHRKLIQLQDNRVTFRLKWDNDIKGLVLTCLNATKQETQLCVKIATSNCDIKSVEITTDSIDDETMAAAIFENKHLEACQIALLKGEKMPLVKVLETIMNEETCAQRTLIKLQDNRVTFQLQRNIFITGLALTCLNATKQETQLCVMLAASNCDIRSVQIKTDVIDDETFASLIECKHLTTVRIEILPDKVNVIELVTNAQTFINLSQKRVANDYLEYEIRSNRVRFTLSSGDKRTQMLMPKYIKRSYMNTRLYKLTCWKATEEETRYVIKLVISNNAISSVDILTESIDDETFVGLIACEHLKELRLTIEKVEPYQLEKLSKFLKDSKVWIFDESFTNGNWKINCLNRQIYLSRFFLFNDLNT